MKLAPFEARSCLATPPSADSNAAPSKDLHDVILNAGGPVWAMDWCPALIPATSQGPGGESSSDSASQHSVCHLALGCHPHGSPPHRIGEPVAGPNCIQLWEVASLAAEAGKRGNATSITHPRLVLGIAHDAGVTWHCRWCPTRAATDMEAPALGAVPPSRLGLLAAALGDGSLRVWAVPHPRLISRRRETQGPSGGQQQQQQQQQQHIAFPLPIAHLSSRHLSGSMPSRVDWLPEPPHDLLLIGCWDGSVAVAKLQPGSGQRDGGVSDADAPPLGMHVLLHFPADTQPLRAVRWLPAGIGTRSIDFAHRYLFLTAGHEGSVKIWDSRDQFNPAHTLALTVATVLDATWTMRPFGIVAALEDASLRATLLEAEEIKAQLTPGLRPKAVLTWRGRNAGALWAVATDSEGARIAYGGEDGVVGLAEVDLKWDKRKRNGQHVPVAGLRILEGAVQVLTQSQLEDKANGGLYDDRVWERKESLAATRGHLPDTAQAVQCVAWSPPTDASGAAWLASGTGVGLIRCQWVHK